MKKTSILIALLASVFMTSCNSQTHECAPSALDVIMSRTSIRSFTGDPVSKDKWKPENIHWEQW